MRNLIVGCGRNIATPGTGSHHHMIAHGGVHRPDDVTMDRNAAVQPDIQADIFQALPAGPPLDPGSFDAVHFECVGVSPAQFGAANVLRAFQNAYALLRAGGWIMIESGVALQQEAAALMGLLGTAGFQRIGVENFSGERIGGREIAGRVLMGKKP